MKKARLVIIVPTLNLGGAEKLIVNTLNAKGIIGFDIHLLILRQEASLLNQLDNTDVTVHLLGMSKRNVLQKTVQLFLLLKKIEPSIIHSHLWSSNLISRILKPLLKSPVVINHYHGLATWYRKRHVLVDFITKRWASKHIVVSDASRDIRLRRERLPPEQLEVLYNFIPEEVRLALNRTANQNRAKSSKITFGMACRLIELKDIPLAIEIIKRLKTSGLNCELIIAGDGPLYQSLNKHIESQGLESCVRLIGFTENLNEFYSSLDFYLITSKSEDLPLSMGEALMAGAVIISKNVGGIKQALGTTISYCFDDIDAEFDVLSNFIMSVDLDSARHTNKVVAENMFGQQSYFSRLNEIYSELKRT